MQKLCDCLVARFIRLVAEAAKKSPELIQLLELHTQFASITPYSQVSREIWIACQILAESFNYKLCCVTTVLAVNVKNL